MIHAGHRRKDAFGFSPLNIGCSDQRSCFTERVVSASKGSPHNNDIFTTFFFFCIRLISRNFVVGIYALKLSTLKRMGTVFFTERLAVRLR